MIQWKIDQSKLNNNLPDMVETEETASCRMVFTQFKRGRTKDSEWKGVDLNVYALNKTFPSL